MLTRIFYNETLLLPVILGGIEHMIIVKNNYFSDINVPLSTRLFGGNKTWRGIVFVPVLTALFSLLWLLFPDTKKIYHIPDTAEQCLYAGLLAGSGYVLFELPNSWLKRRMGIAPGKLPEKKILFVIFDQLDSAAGVTLAFKLYLSILWPDTLLIFILFIISAFCVKNILFLLELKKTRY